MRPKVSAADAAPYGVRVALRRVFFNPPRLARPLPPMIASIGSGFPHGADLWQVAPVTLGIHAAAKDETILDRQADEIGTDRLRARQLLFHQHGAGEARSA